MRTALTSVAIAAAIMPGIVRAAPIEQSETGVGTPTAPPAGRGRSPRGIERPMGLSLEQIRGVMRAHASEFNACFVAGHRRNRQLHGPFVWQIEVDRKGKVASARPYQPSGDAAFDHCIAGVLGRARFPGGPASVETPLVFDPS